MHVEPLAQCLAHGIQYMLAGVIFINSYIVGCCHPPHSLIPFTARLWESVVKERPWSVPYLPFPS